MSENKGGMSTDSLESAAETVAGESTLKVTISDGVEVDILKCKVKHIAKLTKFGALMFGQLGIDSFEAVETKTAKIFDPIFIMDLFSNHSDEFVDLVATFCSLSSDAVNELDLDDAVLIAARAFEINKDFLLKKVAPILVKNQALSASKEVKGGKEE